MSARSQQDAELVVRARAGDDEAFADLVRRYQRPVFSLILRMVRQPQIAEDIAQLAFIKAHRALASFDESRRFSSWLFKIAHNATLDHLRRSKVPLESLDDSGRDGEEGWGLAQRLADPDAVTPFRSTSGRDLGRALERAIGELRPDYRHAVLLRFVEGLSYQEIAEVLEVPLGTVKTNIHRARKELAHHLTEAGWLEEDAGDDRAPNGETGPRDRA